MSNAAAVALSIIEFDGSRSEHTLTSKNVKTREFKISIKPSDIVLVEILDQGLDASQVQELFDLEIGEFDIDETVNENARLEVDPGEQFGNWDFWYENNISQLEFSQRFIRISKGEEVSWLWLLRLASGSWFPVLVNEFGLTGVKTVAEYSWFTESGAPVTWQGGATLYQLSTNLFLENVYGDSPEDPTLYRIEPLEKQLVELLENFCLEDGRIADAAIYLEKGLVSELPAESRKEVKSLLSSYAEYVSFSVEATASINSQLREALEAKSEIYRKIKAFFKSPNSLENAGVLSAFKEVAETGITGAINGSSPNWVW